MNPDLPPPVTKDEAAAALAEIDRVIEQTRKIISHGSASPVLLLWGVIWVVGFADTQFYPGSAGRVWMLLNVAGMAATFALTLSRRSIKSPISKLIFGSWCVLIGYGTLWLLLLAPWVMPGMTRAHAPPWGVRIPAFFCTVSMCGYVIMGLWLSRFFLWVGLVVTAITVIGYYALPDWFYLWMAVFGGGSFLATGLFTRKYWR
jgi:hypothetical protein